MRNISLTLSLTMLFFHSSLFAENCFPNKINFDICKEAKKIQNEIAPNLPQRLSRNMSLVNVMSSGPEVILTAQLTYTKAFLEKNAKAAGQTMSQVDAKMQSFTRNNVCSNQATKSFIELGGNLIMNYRYGDGENAFNVVIKRC